MNKILNEILQFGKELKPSQGSELDSDFLFSSNKEADELCQYNDFAFLIACLAAQGMNANKIWSIPYRIRERGLILQPMAFHLLDFENLEKIIKEKPAIHRFPKTFTTFLKDLSLKILTYYNAVPANIWIWADYDAKKIQENLLKIKGFGPKKAAMTVELLRNFLKVPITNITETNIAPDIHVRRVLFRTGLCNTMDPKEVMQRGKELYPQEPGSLDLPLWKIGKTWCKSKNPKCSECILTNVCEKNMS